MEICCNICLLDGDFPYEEPVEVLLLVSTAKTDKNNKIYQIKRINTKLPLSRVSGTTCLKA